ncbi:MAG: polyprenyl synthetase family protein [Ferruginibacter sp.]
MHSLQYFSTTFEAQFSMAGFPTSPEKLYEACDYFLRLGGKRIRPVSVLMGNELFGDVTADAFRVATAVELFHNFTLVHDDIMDEAPLRRNRETVHVKYGEPTALLAGDVMMVRAYQFLTQVNPEQLPRILTLFNKTATEVCEGQQLDMNFEVQEEVSFEEYLHMITLKTSVLLAASLQLGAILGGAGLGNQHHLYEFGKKLGIAFQVQDDYLDAFGDPEKFGKQPGGDILANKKTFLLIHALETLDEKGRKHLKGLMQSGEPGKVGKVLDVFSDCKVDSWAKSLKEKYFNEALRHLEDVAVLSTRKKELAAFAAFLMMREN